MTETPRWQPVGAVELPALAEARLSAHWAAQVVPAVADAALEHADDDAHTNMLWSAEHLALVGRPLPSGVRIGLRLPSLELILVDSEGAVSVRFALSGRTLADALEWAQRTLDLAAPLSLREYDMPDHAAGNGSPFAPPNPGALEELARWCGNGFATLDELAGREEGASEVACWPHHFDLGGIVLLDEARQIGFGLSLGDGSYAEPYFYVTPWPIPGDAEFPELGGGGQWHTEGFTGALLLASKLSPSGSEQPRQARVYLTSAMQAARGIIPPVTLTLPR
jgi:hypothetical protein